MLDEPAERLRLVDVRVGDALIDVLFERHERGLAVKVIRKRGEIEVSVVL